MVGGLPVRIHIDYFNDVEETEAVYLGAYPDGAGELFRVGRPSICIGGVAREDVVRLERFDDRYVFLGVVERSSWEAHSLLLPREARSSREAFGEFTQALVDAGCILEGDRVDDDGLRVIISVPTGVSDDGWTRAYERIIQLTAGLSVEAFRARVGDDARRRNLAHHEGERRKTQLWHRQQHRGEIARLTRRVLITAACIVIVGWWIVALVTASPLLRPRIAAFGMIVALLPPAIGFFPDRNSRPMILGAAAAGVFALVLAGSLTDPVHVFTAVVLGLSFAVGAGSVGVLFGMFSGFAANERALRETWLFLVLPCLASAIAGVLYAITAVRATDVSFDAAQTIRMTGIFLTGLLLLEPLRRRTLRSMRVVVVPMVVLWLGVWLLGGLR
jgi:hypothetical protein